MKIKFAWKSKAVALVLSMTLAGAIAFADAADVSDALLTGAIDLTYAGNLEKTDDDGRLLVWEGSVGGDFGGTIRWWFIEPSPIVSTTYMGGTVNYYDARWEIWIDEVLVLAGQSAGKTVAPDQLDGSTRQGRSSMDRIRLTRLPARECFKFTDGQVEKFPTRCRQLRRRKHHVHIMI
jgi:hypothetical protein